MLGVALLVAAAGSPARIVAIDRDIAARRARLVAVEAPLVRLIAAIERVERAPRVDDRARRLARLDAWLAAIAPPAVGRAAALRQDLDGLAAARAEIVLRGLAPSGRIGPRSSAATAPIAACRSSSFASPVDGRVVTSRAAAMLGQARGLTLVAFPGAAVTAPASARIAYAGPFRRYGDIVILDHGHGWTSLLTGLDRLDARTGARVESGAVLGSAGRTAPLVTVELSRHGRPIDALAMMRRCLP